MLSTVKRLLLSIVERQSSDPEEPSERHPDEGRANATQLDDEALQSDEGTEGADGALLHKCSGCGNVYLSETPHSCSNCDQLTTQIASSE